MDLPHDVVLYVYYGYSMRCCHEVADLVRWCPCDCRGLVESQAWRMFLPTINVRRQWERFGAREREITKLESKVP